MNQKYKNKTIIVDSSSLITISDNCLIKIIKNLSEMKKLNFTIPESVYEESVINPLKIKQYELNAIRIKDAVEEGYIKVKKSTSEIKSLMQYINNISSEICLANGKPLKLIQKGETEALALAKSSGAKIVMVDERTTRMLVEEPFNMHDFLEKRHHKQITINPQAAREFTAMFSGLKIIRSVELIAFAYECGAMESEVKKSKEALEASLWAAKYAGCAVSETEIKSYLNEVGK
jgi:predicted nucleic acid-binding protein